MMKCEICWDYLQDAAATADGGSEPKKSRLDKEVRRESDVVCTPCGHLFHRRCLLNWFNRAGDGHGSCPRCRKRIDKRQQRTQLRSVYLPVEEDNSDNTPILPAVLDNLPDAGLRQLVETLMNEKNVLQDKYNTQKQRAEVANQILTQMLENQEEDDDSGEDQDEDGEEEEEENDGDEEEDDGSATDEEEEDDNEGDEEDEGEDDGQDGSQDEDGEDEEEDNDIDTPENEADEDNPAHEININETANYWEITWDSDAQRGNSGSNSGFRLKMDNDDIEIEPINPGDDEDDDFDIDD